MSDSDPLWNVDDSLRHQYPQRMVSNLFPPIFNIHSLAVKMIFLLGIVFFPHGHCTLPSLPGCGIRPLNLTSVGGLPGKWTLLWPSSWISICRLVYSWFLFLHKASYVLGVVGYLIMMLTLMGITLIFGFKPNETMDFGESISIYL